MLESKQSAHLESWLDLSIPEPVNDLVKRGQGELLYLFLAEDTTDHMDQEQKDLTAPGENNTRSTVKTVFWLVASISISLLLGQLK